MVDWLSNAPWVSTSSTATWWKEIDHQLYAPSPGSILQEGFDRLLQLPTLLPSGLSTTKTSLQTWIPVVSLSQPPLQVKPVSGSSSPPIQESPWCNTDIRERSADHSRKYLYKPHKHLICKTKCGTCKPDYFPYVHITQWNLGSGGCQSLPAHAEQLRGGGLITISPLQDIE